MDYFGNAVFDLLYRHPVIACLVSLPEQVRSSWEAKPIFVAKWMNILTPSLVELASRTLATELMRRAPKVLRIVETHPGGGQYDCLSIIRTDPNLHLCAFNRLGSFTAFGRFDAGHVCSSQIDVWD